MEQVVFKSFLSSTFHNEMSKLLVFGGFIIVIKAIKNETILTKIVEADFNSLVAINEDRQRERLMISN